MYKIAATAAAASVLSLPVVYLLASTAGWSYMLEHFQAAALEHSKGVLLSE